MTVVRRRLLVYAATRQPGSAEKEPRPHQMSEAGTPICASYCDERIQSAKKKKKRPSSYGSCSCWAFRLVSAQDGALNHTDPRRLCRNGSPPSPNVEISSVEWGLWADKRRFTLGEDGLLDESFRPQPQPRLQLRRRFAPPVFPASHAAVVASGEERAASRLTTDASGRALVARGLLTEKPTNFLPSLPPNSGAGGIASAGKMPAGKMPVGSTANIHALQRLQLTDLPPLSCRGCYTRRQVWIE
ncbi:hypothetical protein BDY21DRAFT_212719 [Lineolata rhizophorae]|uniref:Uncharacterized protein n=1 Tax=Lineolata rhizophorae TaxID=578093 RepID=A0A6A6P4M3_9PEZI|nr:hypothetical protein BDY21DRAFT_212719 [Lineolata rhizophorae]